MKPIYDCGNGSKILRRLALGSRSVHVVALALVLVAAGLAFAAAPPSTEAQAGPEGAAVAEAAEAPAQVVRIDLSGEWKFRGDWEENGLAQGWQRPELDDAEWTSLKVPGTWESEGITTSNPRWPGTEPDDGYNGYAWYRRQFTVPADWREDAVKLHIGAIDDMDWTYVNGKLVGATVDSEAWNRGREYLVPSDALRAGESNVIAIRICDTGGEGGIRQGPVELVNLVALEAAGAGQAAPVAGRFAETRNDMVNIGGSVHVPASMRVNGDVVAVFGSANIEGHVQGDVVAVMGSVRVRPGARIDGEVVSVGGGVFREGDAVIGKVTEIRFLPWVSARHALDNAFGWFPFGRGPFGRFSGFLSKLVLSAIVALFSVALFRNRLEVMARALPMNPGRAAAFGVGGLVLTPAAFSAFAIALLVAIIILVATTIGILLIPAVGAALVLGIVGLAVLVILGTAGVWLSVGRGAAAQLGLGDVSTLSAALLGVLLVTLVASIPVIGILVTITVLIFAFGVALMTGVGADPDWVSRRFGSRRAKSTAAEDVAAGQTPAAEEPPATEPPSEEPGGEDQRPPGPPAQ